MTLVNSDGTLNSSFQVPVNAPVQTLVVVGQKVIIGGLFTTVNRQPRAHIAMVNASGELTSWDPQLNFGSLAANEGTVTAITINGSTVFLGGNFVSSSGISSVGLVEVDSTTAQPLWTQSDQIEAVGGLVVQGSKVFAGIDRIVGSSFASFIDIFDSSSGALITSFSTNSLALTLAVGTSTPLYVGGTCVFPVPGQNLKRGVDPNTGNLISNFNPRPDSTVASIALSGETPAETFTISAARKKTSWPQWTRAPDRQPVGAPEPGNLVNVVVATPNVVVAGGFFSVANAIERTQFAEVDP